MCRCELSIPILLPPPQGLKLSTLEAFLQPKLFTTSQSFYTKNSFTPTILLQQKQKVFTQKTETFCATSTLHLTFYSGNNTSSPPETFLLHKHLHTRSRSLLHQKHVKPNSFFTRKGVSPKVESFYTKGLLHHQFYTRNPLHHNPLTPKTCCTPQILHPQMDFPPHASPLCTAQSTIGIRTYNATLEGKAPYNYAHSRPWHARHKKTALPAQLCDAKRDT